MFDPSRSHAKTGQIECKKRDSRACVHGGGHSFLVEKCLSSGRRRRCLYIGLDLRLAWGGFLHTVVVDLSLVLHILVKESQYLATRFFASGFVVGHDTVGRRDHNVTKLTRWQ
jgi:hypothetical protein